MTSAPPHASAPELPSSAMELVEEEPPSTSYLDALAAPDPPPQQPQPQVKRHRTAPSGDSSLYAATLSTEPSAQVLLGDAYYASTTTAATSLDAEGKGRRRRQRNRKLRLFLGASLAEAGGAGKARHAYAVVYLDQGAVPHDLKHHSQSSAVTEEGAAIGASAGGGGVKPQARGELLGRTERARLQRSLAFKYCTVPFYRGARSVDFAKALVLPYVYAAHSAVHIDMYGAADAEADGALLGTATLNVGALHAARGYIQHVPLQAASADAKRPAGQLRAAVEDVSSGAATYHLDVMCTCIRRARPWGASLVRRTFYTVHAVATSDTRCDDWVLLYRSAPVESVRRKRQGGSMEYNYFSSRPLLATPGLVVVEDSASEAANSGTGLRALLRRHDDASFFSMPSGSFATPTSSRRLKLTVWEDSDQPEMVACSEFSMEQMRGMALGAKLDMSHQSSVVGHATLKFVEKSDVPRYFCLNIQLPDLLL